MSVCLSVQSLLSLTIPVPLFPSLVGTSQPLISRDEKASASWCILWSSSISILTRYSLVVLEAPTPCILFCYLLDLHEVIRCVLGSLHTLPLCSSGTESLAGDSDALLLSGLTEAKWKFYPTDRGGILSWPWEIDRQWGRGEWWLVRLWEVNVRSGLEILKR